MANKMVIDGSDKVTARQMKELFTQIESGAIGGSQIKALLDHRNPFPWFVYIGEMNNTSHFANIDELKKGLIESGTSIDALVSQSTFSDNTNFNLFSIFQNLPLIKTSVSHFGLESATYKQIQERIVGSIVKFFGVPHSIELCPQNTAFLAANLYIKRQLTQLRNYEEIVIISKPIEYTWSGHNCKSLLSLKRVDHETKIPSEHLVMSARVDYGDEEKDSDLKFYSNEWLVFCLKKI